MGVVNYNKIVMLRHVKVNECSFLNSDGYCLCSDGCSYTSWFWAKEQGDNEPKLVIPIRLAPRPNGKCYCGAMRKDCPNFQAYGFDCQGFTNTDHFKN
jgi:hypothetical protein